MRSTRYIPDTFIDCEFDGFMGPLMSMALVTIEGEEFYEVLEHEPPKDPWVAQFVAPILQKDPLNLPTFRSKLSAFLNRFDGLHIIADYPADIRYFTWCLETTGGMTLFTPPLTFSIQPQLSCDWSAVRHNALSDARALRLDYMRRNSRLHRS